MSLPLPFEAYLGTDPYLFASYAHADAGVVYPEIQFLHGRGHRIWYDEGIEVGGEWSEAIADAIEGCAQFLVFMSPRAAGSKHVREEIYYAFSKEKPILCVHLEPTVLPGGLEMRLGPFQAVPRHDLEEAVYRGKLTRALASESKVASGTAAQVQAPPDPARLRSSPGHGISGDPASLPPASAGSVRQPPPGPTVRVDPAPRHVPREEAIDLGHGVRMEFCLIPAGSFEREGNTVTISRDFWMAKYPVTQGEWTAVMGSNLSHFKQAGEGSGLRWRV
jgi:hypothetical protein